MKVGIITFHRAVNFGGILQAYALQQFLLEKSINSEIIDYRCPSLETQYGYSKRITMLKIKIIISAFLRNGVIFENRNGFTKFIDKYLIVSDTIYNPQNIIKANKEYDLFITGSDQVWSTTCAGFDKAFFLDFVLDSKKKNSYAASTGSEELNSKYLNDYKHLLCDFNNISVREKGIEKELRNLLNREIYTVLDPTLLLNHEHWKNRFEIIDYKKKYGHYLLVYLISEDLELLKSAKEYAQKNNLKILYINDRIYKHRGAKNLRKVCPDEWVNLFLHADIIFTNSFHGLAFSINFKKDFSVWKLKSNEVVNGRLKNLLNVFNFNIEDFDLSGFLTICFDDNTRIHVDAVLEKERNKSDLYLKRVLYGCNE